MLTTKEWNRSGIKARWEALSEEHGALRLRDAAERLGVSEAALVSCQLGQGVTRLRPEFGALFEAFESLGEIMASTRNEYAVIEKHGQYQHIDISEHVGLVLAHEIDLRLFMGHFHSAYAVKKMHRNKPLHSIQFFDGSGTSLHKVYAMSETAREAMEAIIARFTHEDQESVEPQGEPRVLPDPNPDQAIDVEGFQKAWRELQDTHHFFGMLRTFGVTRTQALRLAPEGYATRVDPSCLDAMLHGAVREGVSIMAFVNSPGCIEIHTGPVERVIETGDWINVLDPRFNLHLNRLGIESAWIVRKPTEDGDVTSLELFDERGETIAMFFGERKPGAPEREDWRALLREIASQQIAWTSGTRRGGALHLALNALIL